MLSLFRRTQANSGGIQGSELTLLSKVTIGTLTLCMGMPLAHADLKTAMQDMFNSSSAMDTSTPPNVYKSQSSNIAVLGGFDYRVPTQNAQIFSYTPTTLKGGCGGVDLKLGSFSWINDDKFKQLLQAIGNNTQGILFTVALSSLSPLIGGKLEMLLKQIQDAANYFGNSCRDAEMLVAGLSGKKTADTYQACMAIQRVGSKDENEAKQRCQDYAPDDNKDAAKSNDPNLKALATRDVNLMWDALSKSGLSAEQKELIMNITGSKIIFAQSSSTSDQPDVSIDSPIPDVAVLEKGNTPNDASVKAGDVTIDNWRTCDVQKDPDCLNPGTTKKVFTPFKELGRRYLEGVYSSMQNNKRPDDAALDFMNRSSLPLMMLLKYAYMAKDPDIAGAVMSRFSALAGVDFAYNFLSRGMRDAHNYLSNGAARRGIEETEVNRLEDKIRAMMAHLDAERTAEAAKQTEMAAMVEHVTTMNRQIMAGLPSSLQNMLAFSGSMGTLRGR